MPLNIPNILTLLRIVTIPVVLVLYHQQFVAMSLGVLCLGLITDFLDGYLARRLKQETHFGAIFDPIADKFVALGFYGYIGWAGWAPAWFVGVLLARNFAQLMSVPILIWWLKRQFKVKPTRFAKWATAISDFYIFVPLYLAPYFSVSIDAWMVPMVTIAAFELYILATYLPRLWAIAHKKHDTFT